MLFEKPGLDIAVIITSLNMLTSVTFILSNIIYNKNQLHLVKQQQISQKTISDDVQQLKITVQNQRAQQLKNDQISTNNCKNDNIPSLDQRILSPSSNLNENQGFISTTSRQQKIGIICQTQISQRIKQNDQSSNNNINTNVQLLMQQQQDTKTLSQLQKYDHSSFAAVKITQCKQCEPDVCPEEDGQDTEGRKRNMSIPNELQENLQMEIEIEKQQQQQKQQQNNDQDKYQKFIIIQNNFLMFSCIFFILSIFTKIEDTSQFYENSDLNEQLYQTLVLECFGSIYYNIFTCGIILILEQICKCNQIIIRLLLFIYNIILPFYIFSTMKTNNQQILQQYIMMLGWNCIIQQIYQMLYRLLNWNKYPLRL